jgi:hypothetical protein
MLTVYGEATPVTTVEVWVYVPIVTVRVGPTVTVVCVPGATRRYPVEAPSAIVRTTNTEVSTLKSTVRFVRLGSE